MTFRQYLFRFFSACFFSILFIGLFNRLVDPFWYYRDFEVDGFNVIKTRFKLYERDVKPALLIRDQPEAILLGSSYSEIGFDPNHPRFTDFGQLKSMNYAFAGAPWAMVQCEFEFAVAHAPIKRALIGIHSGELPKADCAHDFPSIGRVSMIEFLFSSRALAASIDTIRHQKKKHGSHTREGMFFYARNKAGVNKRFTREFGRKAKENPKCLETAQTVYELQTPLAESNYDLSGLQRMIKTANKHRIQLVLFFYPKHAYGLELEMRCGRQEAMWRAMKQITHLIESQAAEPVQIWHFYGYNDITAELIGNTANFWQDSTHYNFEMGNLMLEDMFNDLDQKPKFGRRVTSQHIDEDLNDFLKERTEHLLRYPEFQNNFQKLLEPLHSR